MAGDLSRFAKLLAVHWWDQVHVTLSRTMTQTIPLAQCQVPHEGGLLGIQQ